MSNGRIPQGRPRCEHGKNVGRCAKCQELMGEKYEELDWLDKLKLDNRGVSGKDVVKAVDLVRELEAQNAKLVEALEDVLHSSEHIDDAKCYAREALQQLKENDNAE